MKRVREESDLVKVVGRGHSECILQCLQESWENNQFSNVTIICRDQINKHNVESHLFANKLVLAAASKPFARLLDGTEDDVVMIVPDYDRSTFKLFLEYIHSGQVYLNKLPIEFNNLLREWGVQKPEAFPDESQITSEISKKTEKRIIEKPTATSSIEGISEKTEISIDDLRAHKERVKNTAGNGEKKVKKPLLDNDFLGYNTEADEEMDEKSDKDDLLLSLNLMREEKRINQEVTENISDLTETVQRYKAYVRHFLGVEVTDNNLETCGVKIPCGTCGKMINKNYMVEHIKTVHNTERPYLCDQCGQTFPLQTRLRVHQRIQHSELSCHQCNVCGKSFKRAAYLQKHMTLHEGLKPYACKYCDRKFRLPAVLSKHIRTHTGERPYECEICQKRFGSRSTYVNHTLTHKKNSQLSAGFNFDPVTQLLKCDVCQLTFHREYAYILHKAGHTGETPALPCAHCDAFFASLKLLRQHTNESHADALYSCDKCDKKFANKTTLSTHALIHKQGGRFGCEQCNKTFATESKMLNHVKVMHSEERPFSCQSCDKSFKTKEMLHKHKRTHTDERPYICPKCPKAFRQSTHLACHILLHTGEKPFTCQYCEKSFTHKNNLNSHIKIHTGERNQCKTCQRIFPSIVKLRRHESTHQVEDQLDVPSQPLE